MHVLALHILLAFASATCLNPPPFPRSRLLTALSLQVCHELPASVSQAVFREAHRLLRPGGTLAVMVSERSSGWGEASVRVAPSAVPILQRCSHRHCVIALLLPWRQEMDPSSPAFQRVLSNPFPYVAFKSTEPWLLEYLGLDMSGAMVSAGFAPPRQANNSPKHKTVVAVKR